jgi:hypothetical protein
VRIPTTDGYVPSGGGVGADTGDEAFEEKRAAAMGEHAKKKLYVHGDVVDKGMLLYELMDMEDELCA